MEDLVLTGAERKLSRQIMAELNHASCHLGLILNACLTQWWWGLRGGKPKDEAEYPAISEDACPKPIAKKITKQVEVISRYVGDLLRGWGLDGKTNIRDGLLDSTNTKVLMINVALKKHGPAERVYHEDLTILTSVLALAFRDLQKLERHNDKTWRYLCQTLETLAKLIAKPEHHSYAEAIYADVKPWFMGTAALCDWSAE